MEEYPRESDINELAAVMEGDKITRVLLVILLCGIALLLTGCVPSLHPLYTDTDLIFEPQLIGVWAADENGEPWRFKKATDKGYKLLLTSHGKTGEFYVHLLKLGTFYFLDLYPVEPDMEDKNDFYKNHLVGIHSFMRVSIEPAALKLSMLDYYWLNDLLKTDPDLLKHEFMDDTILLTASTKELQAFVLKHAENERAFSKPYEMHRKK